MADIKLSYFDFNGGRGEDCRLALHVAGVDFTDDRLKGAAWRERKPSTPFGSLPVLEIDGKAISDSNAILAYIGRTWGLHPVDPWEAARHEAVMGAVEDLRHASASVLRVAEPEKQPAREAWTRDWLLPWAARMSRQIEGPFLSGAKLHVADLKLFVILRWFSSGGVDHIPGSVFADHPALPALEQAVGDNERVQDWHAQH